VPVPVLPADYPLWHTPGVSWEEVSAAIIAAECSIAVLPRNAAHAANCLSGLGISDQSWLGAVVAHTGGLLLDDGWLRVLGSGAPSLPDILAAADRKSAYLPVGHDVLGGQFVWTPNESGRPTVHYFGPDALEWHDLELGYAEWLGAMLGGALDGFYETLRWPGWAEEVAACRPDQGIHTFPPPWSKEGKDLASVSRRVVPIAELISLHEDTARQLSAVSTPPAE
jgi:hypothetical protein